MPYSHFKHCHNFAVWCAARAVQRNFAKTPIFKEALEGSGVVEFIQDREGVVSADSNGSALSDRGFKGREIGRMMGVGYTAVSQERRRLREKAEKDKKIQTLIQRIEHNL